MKTQFTLALLIMMIIAFTSSYFLNFFNMNENENKPRLDKKMLRIQQTSNEISANNQYATPEPTKGLKTAENVTQDELSKYNEWVSDALAISKDSGCYVIVIDKLRYRLYLVNKGVPEFELPIELGFNPIDDKIMEGDGCTPEGFYEITEKRDIGKTKFYRGYLLDYPNELDRREFALSQANGGIPKDATIGGLIMIHGHGSGKDPDSGGSNWTLGCVALSNSDIDRIFSQIGVGTSVVIVRTCDVL